MKINLQQVLKREMKNRGISINKLSKSCRIPVSVLHGWIQGALPSAKNLHHIQSLSEYLGLSFEMLLFNREPSRKNAIILFSSEFIDGKSKYKILIEKMEE